MKRIGYDYWATISWCALTAVVVVVLMLTTG